MTDVAHHLVIVPAPLVDSQRCVRNTHGLEIVQHAMDPVTQCTTR